MWKDIRRRDWIWLSVIYLLSQGMLLIVSGRWWDDWCFYQQPSWALHRMALELGRPSVYWIVSFAKALPESGYRILTFFLFYGCMLYLYRILKTWLSLDAFGCFWICALYAVIPVNDVRIVLAVFPYSVGLLFFMAGLSGLAGLLYEGRMNRRRRGINLLLFLFSFILHSNLCFYAVALLMIGMKEKKVTAMHGYLDYLLLPVLFFAVKSLFFPAYGGYENYNAITGAGLIKAGFYLLPAVIYVMRALFVNFCGIGKNAFFVIGILLLISYLIQNIRKIIGGGDKDSFKRRRIKGIWKRNQRARRIPRTANACSCCGSGFLCCQPGCWPTWRSKNINLIRIFFFYLMKQQL